MVNNDKIIMEELQKCIVHLAELPPCDNKVKIMSALLDLEWSLRDNQVLEPVLEIAHQMTEEEIKNSNFLVGQIQIEDELLGGHEEPWSE